MKLKRKKTMDFKQELGLIRDMPDDLYHQVLPPEEAFYSSSQFKEARKDIEMFHKKYITKEVKDEVSSTTQSNFDIGSLYHCMVLEPHKVADNFALFKGKVKRGKEYEDFVKENEGKTIVSQKQYDTASFIAKAAKNNDACSELLSEGEAEVSLFVEMHGLRVKVRADWISFERGFILDMKSTTGNPKLADKIKSKISSLDYDLSAALYLDAFNTYLAKEGLPLIETFKWCFDSKDTGTSKVWTASDKMIEVGRAKYMKAINNIKEAQAKDWEFQDTDNFIDPIIWDAQEWLVEKDEDLL